MHLDGQSERDVALAVFQDRLGYHFTNPEYLERALTHSSRGVENYERLEFLGDRVLGLVIAEILYRTFPFEKEGSLARRHSALACTETLAKTARDLDIPTVVIASSAELASGGNKQDNLLADCMEAIIGAIFIDKGYVPCQEVITSLWGDKIYTLSQPPVDSKTALQEWAQARGLPIPVYEIVERSGPDHAPQFKIRVTLKDIEPMESTGSSRRVAEKTVAQVMLDKLNSEKT
ncbi:MAG: ribonuclease III [Alphaproteobacteria bacterium RIFCSPHIGHO2_12_FULL_45_9]|nr:MAG: ribonuclease III [Alphaproteobacteria bacterium RIFCSPHIGHO2_02_FULL_46_13]OFW95041.1 MAG: ribonuclease III [Alphaproteobacteria bacterium RIFCSPHIGHO2_12_FULL_45_9]